MTNNNSNNSNKTIKITMSMYNHKPHSSEERQIAYSAQIQEGLIYRKRP